MPGARGPLIEINAEETTKKIELRADEPQIVRLWCGNRYQVYMAWTEPLPAEVTIQKLELKRHSFDYRFESQDLQITASAITNSVQIGIFYLPVTSGTKRPLEGSDPNLTMELIVNAAGGTSGSKPTSAGKSTPDRQTVSKPKATSAVKFAASCLSEPTGNQVVDDASAASVVDASAVDASAVDASVVDASAGSVSEKGTASEPNDATADDALAGSAFQMLQTLAEAAAIQLPASISGAAKKSSSVQKQPLLSSLMGCTHAYPDVSEWRPVVEMWYENGKDMTQLKSDNITDKGLFREAIIGPPPAMPNSIFYEKPYKCRLCDRRFVVCTKCFPYNGENRIATSDGSAEFTWKRLQQHLEGRFHTTCQLNDYQEFLNLNENERLSYAEIKQIVSKYGPDSNEKHGPFDLERCNKILQVWRQIVQKGA